MARFDQLLDEFFYRPDEAVDALFDPGHGLADAPVNGAEEPPSEHLAFRLAEETYAVPIDRVREISRVPVLTEIPRASKALLGVLDVRGEVLPVYDLKLRLGLCEAPAPIAGPEADLAALPRTSRVLVVHDPKGDAGILVDQVLEVVKLRPATLEAPPDASRSGAAVAGLGRKGAGLFVLLDLAQVLP